MQALERHSKDKLQTISRKFYLPCQKRLEETGNTTKDWLKIGDIIQAKDKNKIYRAIMSGKNSYVVKIGESSTIEKEYNISKRLSYLSGIMKYTCFFTCDDDFKQYESKLNMSHLCKGIPGTSMKVLVMPYLSLGSVSNYIWKMSDIDILKSIIKQVLLTLMCAYNDAKIVYSDMHLDNIMIKKTTKEYIDYEILGTKTSVLSYGYSAILMDFEYALTDENNQNPFAPFFDFNYLIGNLVYSKINLQFNIKTLTVISTFINTRPPFTLKTLNKIGAMIDSIECISDKLPNVNLVYNPNII